MEIQLDRRTVRQIRLAAQEAIEEGDNETLREEILEAFSEDQVEELERHLDTGDLYDFLGDILEEWSGDEADELLELLEAQLAENGVELKFEAGAHVADADEDSEEAATEDAEDADDEDDEDDEEFEDEEGDFGED